MKKQTKKKRMSSYDKLQATVIIGFMTFSLLLGLGMLYLAYVVC